MRGTALAACANSNRASPAVLLLTGICATADVPAQAVEELVLEKVTEVIDTQERISGGAVTGVSFGDTEPTGEVALDQLWGYFGGAGVSEVHVQLTTIDGRYLATFAKILDQPVAGWVRLRADIKQHRDFLVSNYSTDEIAVLVTSEAPGDEAVTYPARWGRCGPTDIVRVFVNAEGADAIFEALGPDGQWQQPACHNAGTSSFKFDRICSVPISHFLKYGDVEILRKRGARYARPIVVRVPVPRSSDSCRTGGTLGGGAGDD